MTLPPHPEPCRAHRCPVPTTCKARGYCVARGAPADAAEARAWAAEAFSHRLTLIEEQLFAPLFFAARQREPA